jgi:outer membrane usher protein
VSAKGLRAPAFVAAFALATSCAATAASGSDAVHASLAARPSATTDANAAFEPAIYAIRFNGRDVNDGAIVLRDAAGALYAPLALLRELRVALDVDPTKLVRFEGAAYYRLDAIHGLVTRLDEVTQRLALDIPLARLDAEAVDGDDRNAVRVPLPPRAAQGSMLDYDLASSGGAGLPPSLGASLSAASPLGSGMLSLSAIGGTSAAFSGIATWQRDVLAAHASLRVGASATALPVLSTNGVALAFDGVQWASNDATRREGTRPLPSVSGIASGPTTLDVYVNNMLYAANRHVDAGPFQLSNLPAVDGQGQVSLVERDALGQTRTVSTSYYDVPDALRAGLHEFSLQAGFENDRSALGNAPGRPPFVGVGERVGLSDRVTLEASAAGDPGARDVAFGGIMTSPRLGALEFGGAFGAGLGARGTAWNVDYAFATPRWNVGLNAQGASPGYRLIGTGSTFVVARSATGSLGVPLARGSLALSYGAQRGGVDVDGSRLADLRLASVSYRRAFGDMEIGLNAARTSGRFASTTFAFQSTFFVGRASAIVSQSAGGAAAATSVFFDRPRASQAQGVGYFFDAQRGSVGELSAGADAALPFGIANAVVSTGGGGPAYQANLAGGVAFARGHAAFSRPLGDGFALVESPGYPHVGVVANGVAVGRTDRNGELLVPNLQPYGPNTIALDARDLPLAVDTSDIARTIVPAYRGGAVVAFAIRSGGFVVRLAFPNGEPVPSGATLTLIGTTRQWIVGDGGLAYVDGVTPGRTSRFAASGGDVSCTVAITVPNDLSAVPDLGSAVCR